ncbi:MAG: MmgE/PrpD family protein, partial [Erysipelotrichaceae bacterium]|nr:MmgE/PrpD family protein [Erysipelotrichaceae bacterium]
MNSSIEYLKMIDDVWKTPVPTAVMERARRSLLDYLAVTCAGAEFQKDKLDKYWEFAQPEEGKFRAIGTGKDLVLKEAVFLNGLNGHALDFDDGTNSGIIHLGSPIFSLLLPLAQRYGKRVDEVLRAAVTGYEASYTMAVSIQPGHKAMGYHATGTCGTLGATLAAAYMLGFSDEERFQAFASAAVAASGMLKVLDDGSELKPYNVAKTSLLALTALQLGKSDFKGHADPLGGRGFFKMMTGTEDVQMKPVLLNGSYAIMKSYTKPYASCRYTHPAVEAAIHLRDQVKPEDVEEINVRTY